MKIKLLLTLTISIISTALFSQSSSIKGKILDAGSAAPIPGVTVRIDSSTIATITDLDGFFKINNIQPGTYNLIYDGGKLYDLASKIIVVLSSEPADASIALDRAPIKTDGIIIRRTKPKQDNVVGFLEGQKKAVTVGDGYTAEQAKLTPSKDVSDVLKKVNGASIQDNKFVIIRGLNDRYNAAYLNDAPLPSSESDRKAFAFDIFPSNMLDNLIITKTASPDLPGEFAGGIIKINTKNIPDQNFQSFSISGGYNAITTGKKQITYQGGQWDWLGVDDGSRAMPSVIPDKDHFPINIDDQAALAKKTNVDWSLQNKTFAPNLNLQYSLGFSDTLAGKPFGVIMALTYNKSSNYNETIRRGWTGNGADNTTASQLDFDYLDKVYSEKVLAGSLANFSVKMNRNNVLSFKNIYSINSDDRVISRSGSTNPLESNPTLIQSDATWFTGNKIYSGQLIGEHYLPKQKMKINWVGSLSNIERSIPNLRRNIYSRLTNINDPGNPNPTDTVYTANIGGANVGSNYGGGMFFSENKENIYSFKADVSHPINIKKSINEIKVGVFYQNRNRAFFARQLGYTKYSKVGGDVTFDETLLYLSRGEIFSNENMGLITPPENGNNGVGGFKLTDGTKYTDAYNASSSLLAAYVMADNKYKAVRLVWGARMESFSQQLHALKADQSKLNINLAKLDVLPSANFIYSINKEQNLRASYSQTLNRPEYRELAPFAFYDFNTNFVISGNDSLRRAKIHNMDVRYEIYPDKKGEVFSVSGFYKEFIDPIEQISRVDVTNEISFRNVPKATNYGVELELRLLLSTIFSKADSLKGLNKFLTNTTAFSNLAIIRSVVDVTSIIGSQDATRPLQGQSPYVFNSGIQYVDTAFGMTVSLSYNTIAPRIYIVGNINEPNIWENGRNFIDLQVTKSLWHKKLDLKFNVQNLLAQRQIFYQNRDLGATYGNFFNTILTGDAKNKNGYNTEEDDLVWSTSFGSTFSLSATLKF
ncbi:MAG: TonB-dependent receptor [Bacteroidetes bacterium]|nr:TonB-dependent receptor [Bacteroidota bacterium]